MKQLDSLCIRSHLKHENIYVAFLIFLVDHGITLSHFSASAILNRDIVKSIYSGTDII